MISPRTQADPWSQIEGADYITATVSIIQAEDLVGEPTEIDAFCRVWIGKRKMKKLTQVFQNSDKPVWNETMVFEPIRGNMSDWRYLLVEVFDHAHQPKPKDLGFFKFDLFSLKCNQTVKGWFSLKDTRCGKVLAEIKVQRCMDKNSSEILRRSIRARHKETGQKYCDPDFKCSVESILSPVHGKNAPHLTRRLASWMRPCDFIDEPKTFCNGVESGDVIQGVLGDCWFLGSAAIVATRDDLLYPLVVEEAPECGFYCFKFFKDGHWRYVTIDDRMPVSKGKEYLFAHCQDRQEIWVPLMEKAYAKLHGCYQHLEGGSIAQGLMDMTGEAAETFKWDKEKFPDVYKKFASGEFFDELENMLKVEEYLVGCSLQMDDGSEKDMGMGIMSGHAYSLLDVAKIKDDKGKEWRLVKVRNPWGGFEWNGDWSDESPLWTPRLKKELNLTVEDDGTFWIDWDNFLKQYNNIMVLRLLQDEVGHKWTRNEEFGAWVGSSAAGSSANRATWHLSPQYRLTVKKETQLFIALAQDDRRLSGNYLRYPTGIGFDVRQDPEVHPGLPIILNPDEGLVLTMDYFKGRDIAKCLTVKPGTYRLIASVFEPGTEAKYYLAVYSYWPITMERIKYNVLELEGAWVAGKCGGNTFTDKWIENPRFELVPEHKREINIVITLRLSDGSMKYPLDLYVLTNTGPNAKPEKKQIKYQNAQPIASKLLVSYVTLKQSDGPFMLIPVTSDPNQLGKFVLRVYSPLADVYDMKEISN